MSATDLMAWTAAITSKGQKTRVEETMVTLKGK